MAGSRRTLVCWISGSHRSANERSAPEYVWAMLRTLRKLNGRPLWAVIALLLIVGGVLGARWWTHHAHQQRFITIGRHGFRVHGEPFFPMAVNYILSKRLVGDSLWLGPSIDYSDSLMAPRTRTADLAALRAQMELVREIGFNTVRLVGCSDLDVRDGHPGIPVRDTVNIDRWLSLDPPNRARYLLAMEDVVRIVGEAGLKAILLIGIRPNEPLSEEHFISVADRFAEDTTVMAYDLYNEPLYFDPVWRDKNEIKAIGGHWRTLMREHAPWQLWTIGLANLREFLEWDPAVIDADFISFHPYEHEPGQVMNELYYYGHHCPKPWIVGETSLPADNDSVPWAEQLDFARATLRRSAACGAWGYSWWQFQDVEWHRFHPDHMGVLDRKDSTRTRAGRMVRGSVKPVAEAFAQRALFEQPGECDCRQDYYNWTGGSGYRLTGRLVNELGRGVPGGIVLAWTPDWMDSRNTVTREDGTFELVTDLPLGHWMASAPGRTRAAGEVDNLVADTAGRGLVHRIGEVRLWSAFLAPSASVSAEQQARTP
mgnify:CR=1 FL=1